MKLIEKILCVVFVLAAFCFPAAGITPIFTVSPTVVSNTYSGFITLQITGLNTGEGVVMQKFVDANTNGVVDGKDPLVQQFTLTDGQNGQVIGGITNYNVPGDLNATAGSITTMINFQNGDFIQTMVAKYLYVLSSPSNHFTPITNSFNVTNFPFAQKFTGNVVSNSTSATVSNAFVIIFPPPRSGHDGPGNPLGGTVANNSGNYTIAMPTGTYTLLVFATNYLTSLANPPVLTLAASQTITTNLSLTNASATITGSLVDSTNNAVKLPGVFMPFSGTNLLSSCFSDTNGNFLVSASAGTWSGASDDSGLIIHGYVAYNKGTNVNSGSSGVSLPLPRANALFYGTVKDNLGNPIVDIDINDQDSSNIYSMDGYTDTNGNYFVGALGLGSSDPWQLGFSGESSGNLTNYDISQPWFDGANGTNLAVGTAVLQNFTIILATNTISGTVKDSNNNLITNVYVFGNATIGGVPYFVQATSSSSGSYSFNVANGTWSLSLNCGGNNNSIPSNDECPNSIQVNVNGTNVTTNIVVQSCGSVQINSGSPLSFGETNAYYSTNLQASSCYPSYNWQQTGGTLPPGLTLYSSGNLSGVPTASGVYNFSVQVTDGNNDTTNQNYSLSISNGVSITTSALPNGTNGYFYSQQIHATNGQTPYSWSVSSGNLPANLSLSGGGLISGMAATNGTFNFTVEASDALGGNSFQPLSLFLASTNIPSLAIGTASGQIFVLWPAGDGTNFVLQSTTNLVTGPWVPVTNGVPQYGYSLTNNSPQMFYRLQ